MNDNQTARECPVLPGYFFTRSGMFSVGSSDGPFWKGYPCKLKRGKIYRRIKTVDGKYLFVHRMVGFTYCYNPLPDVFTVCDHINGKTEDNRACNLRWVTQVLNLANNSARNAYRIKKKPITVRGRKVWIKTQQPTWQSRVTLEGTTHKLGYFDTEQAACDCSRAFRARKWKELYLRILKEHEVSREGAPSFSLQHVRPPRTATGPIVSNPVVQRPRKDRAPRFCSF